MGAEINDYERLKKIGIRMPDMLSYDLKKERIVKEYIPGNTIFDLVLSDRMKPKYTEQLKDMCRLLYAARVNIDYFPTNFIVCKEELYYVDYECNDYMEEWNFENWGIQYWSRTDKFLEYVKAEKI